MTYRLIWFCILISALIAVATLGSFKEVFNSPTRNVQVISFDQSQQETDPKENKEKVIIVDDITLGKQIYQKANCTKCHGANGEGVPQEQGPALAAQHDWYLYDQLIQMKNKDRINDKMYPHIENLSQDDFKKLAKYISSLRIK